MFKYLKKYRLYLLLAPIFMVLEVSMDLVQPALMSKIIDEGVLGLSNNNVGNLNIVISNGLKMIGFVAIGGLCGFLCGVFANLASQNFGNDIRKECFNRIMSFSFEQTDKFSTGSLVTRITNDVTQVQNMVGQFVRGVVRTAMFLFGGSYCLISLDKAYGKVIAWSLPIVVIIIIFVIKKANPMFDVLQKKLDHVNAVMQENVSGVRVVKAYVKEKYEEDRFGKANDDLVGTQLKVLLLFSYMSPLINIVLNFAVVAIIKIGSIEVKSGVITPGKVMAAITYVSLILNGVMMLIMIFQTISRGVASMNRLNEVLECTPSIVDGNEQVNSSVKGKVEFKNVSFSYDDRNNEKVLDGINLTINPGETVGILGATGSGKSSLVNLIPRFYDATKGQVLVDNVDVKQYKLHDLREKIAISLQKSELFSTTIKENISWGRKGADDEEIKQAAKAAQAASFVSETSDGYDTVVAERGMSLSGGQKQRIAISRALLKKSEILIFDDSTSALDLKTEAELYKSLRTEYKDVTKIIIAQRVASVKGADRIAVIDNGSIAALGTHEELLKNSTIYQDIYNSQLKNGGKDHE